MNQSAQPPAIRMQDATVGARWDQSLPMVTGVNWTVAPGEFWVVGGGQQSGKTDFLMLAAGVMPPLAGSLELFGRDTREFGEAELAERLRVACVFEHGQLFSHMTLAENIALPLRYRRNLGASEAGDEIRGLLDLLELSPLAGALPARVSRDWLKRAALARALVLQPRVLLCDNPLNGLGARHREWWWRFLDQLWHGHAPFGGEPMTVVVTTEELAPWQHPERRFALLQGGQFFPLGAWAEAARSADPAVAEWLTGIPATTI